MEQTIERTDISYLRPAQVEEMHQERQALEKKLQTPHIEDKGAVRRQLHHLMRSLETQSPKPVQDSAEEGTLVRREQELRAAMLEGMPSMEEMRKCPPGATDKHIAWEKRNKPRMTEWKNIMLRLNHGTSERDVANFERHRPLASTLNMDNAIVPGKQFFMPPVGAGLPVVFSDEQMAFLRKLNPDMANMLGTLSNVDRQKVKDVIAGESGIGLAEDKPAEAPAKKKRIMTQAQKDALAKGRAAKKAG